MGGILSLGSLACCCTSQAAMCLCSACPSCKNSTSSRIMYAMILLLTTVVSCILLAPGLHDQLKKVPFCKDEGGEDNRNILEQTFDINSPAEKFQFDCSAAVGYLAVYRLCFIVTLFFLLMALIMVNVKTSNDPRAPIQNGEFYLCAMQFLHDVDTNIFLIFSGFWGIKYILIIGGMIGAFFIPEGDQATFGKAFLRTKAAGKRKFYCHVT